MKKVLLVLCLVVSILSSCNTITETSNTEEKIETNTDVKVPFNIYGITVGTPISFIEEFYDVYSDGSPLKTIIAMKEEYADRNNRNKNITQFLEHNKIIFALNNYDEVLYISIFSPYESKFDQDSAFAYIYAVFDYMYGSASYDLNIDVLTNEGGWPTWIDGNIAIQLSTFGTANVITIVPTFTLNDK